MSCTFAGYELPRQIPVMSSKFDTIVQQLYSFSCIVPMDCGPIFWSAALLRVIGPARLACAEALAVQRLATVLNPWD
jgi:hypothetical protein